MDFGFSEEEERFREKVRAFLKSNLSEDREEEAFREPKGTSRLEFLCQWRRRLYENGFVGLAWPKKYGGQAASQIEQAIFNEEVGRFRAPTVTPSTGITTCFQNLATLEHAQRLRINESKDDKLYDRTRKELSAEEFG
jgi:alkylation response protein AidB-like acyl-CoA dehydrogenase